ncbi:unnamed protein product [Tuber aestivum]|uniref:Uncharacterized protein n=1 Tax=Tuber aestivum TaxID=59557 RepID=A0A292Q6Z5_9PEZI|nr:unnamed protein product [Tuber aestivum]
MSVQSTPTLDKDLISDLVITVKCKKRTFKYHGAVLATFLTGLLGTTAYLINKRVGVLPIRIIIENFPTNACAILCIPTMSGTPTTLQVPTLAILSTPITSTTLNTPTSDARDYTTQILVILDSERSQHVLCEERLWQAIRMPVPGSVVDRSERGRRVNCEEFDDCLRRELIIPTIRRKERQLAKINTAIWQGT